MNQNQIGSTIRKIDSNTSITVRVQPNASLEKVVISDDYVVKIWVRKPPVDSAANKAIIKFLSKRLGISKSRINITSGHQSKEKVILIQDLEPSFILDKLA